MNTFYTHPTCFRVVSDAAHAPAAKPFENLGYGAAQEMQGCLGQKRKPYPLMLHIERDPFAGRPVFDPTFQLSDPSFGLDCADGARKPWTGEPKGGGKGRQPL
jgi:hypothetical protein